ncbi:MAG: hypothetical protein M0R32_06745 [Candidatus Cloacimonetes bacterium]|jgi:hypothetical protein|nr:hypothetical protein [Candidatus Cloacimonadota bacterium]
MSNLSRTFNTYYESDYSFLDINLYEGIPSGFSIYTGGYAELTETHKARGGLLTFGRTSGNETELHAIRLRETVEAAIVAGETSSKVDRLQPFAISSNSDFISRGLKSANVFEKSNQSVIFATKESLQFVSKESSNQLTAVDNPTPFSVVSSAAGVNPSGKAIISLYMDSGNIYAGVEE